MKEKNETNYTQIRIKNETLRALMLAKVKFDLKSYDSVIIRLLKKENIQWGKISIK